jgi:hypothetical protein
MKYEYNFSYLSIILYYKGYLFWYFQFETFKIAKNTVFSNDFTLFFLNLNSSFNITYVIFAFIIDIVK